MDDITELKIKQLEEQFGKINKQLEELPEKISASVENTINLKIELAVHKIKNDFWKWLVPLILGGLFTCIGTIFNFIKLAVLK